MVLSIGQAINAHTSKFSVYKPIFETVFKIEFSPKDCTGIFDKPITSCNGNKDCLISFTPYYTTVADCGKCYADYFYGNLIT